QGMTINRKKDGSLYYEEKIITPIKNAKGELTHLVSTGKDVTERVEAELALTQSQTTPQDKASSLAAVNAITELLHRTPDIQSFFNEAVQAIVEHLQAPSIALFVLNNAQKQLEMRASYGFNEEVLKVGSTLPVEGSLS